MNAALSRRLAALEATRVKPRRGLAALSLDQLKDKARRLGLMDDQPGDSAELRRLRTKAREMELLPKAMAPPG